MKVLLHHLMPFALAAEGWQATIAHTRAAVEGVGIEADHLRWYDGRQTGDILHFFGRMPAYLIPFAHQKQMKVVVTETFAAAGPPAPFALAARRAAMRVLEKTLPGQVLSFLDWDSYRRADACVVSTEADALRLKRLFRVPPERIHVLAEDLGSVSADRLAYGRQLKAVYEGLRSTS